jgi:hypothetical protein
MAEKHGSFVPRFNPKFARACAALTEQFAYINILTMALLRGLFWLVLFVFFTFCFIVLFQYGTHDFVNGFQKEFARVKSLVVTDQAKKPKK